MKKMIFLLIVLAMTIGLYAQNTRMAYFTLERIMTECDLIRDAERLFQVDMENWRREVEDIEAEITRLEQEYETRRLMLSDDRKTEAEAAIRAKRAERQQYVERVLGENGLAAQRNAELLAPIMEKMRTVVEKIATEENYNVVFDSSSSGIFWAEPRFDITQQVIFELNRGN